MILKALYDYYHRDENLPAPGLEEKEIGFLLVLSIEGKFMYFEDCRIDKKHARTFLVKKHVDGQVELWQTICTTTVPMS